MEHPPAPFARGIVAFIPLEWHIYFDISLKIRTFASDEATKIHSMDVNDSQHGDVDCFCFASSSSSGDSLFATRCGSLRVFFSLWRESSRTSSAWRTLLAWKTCLWFRLCDSFSDTYTRWNLGGCIARLLLLLADLYGEWYLVHSFASIRKEGKSILFLFRETTFDVSLACHGASCASCCSCLIGCPHETWWQVSLYHWTITIKIHKRGCSRDSSSLRSSEWQECSGWHLIMKSEQ